MFYDCVSIHDMSMCTCVCMSVCVCVSVHVFSPRLCGAAVQRPGRSQSSHLPGERLEIEAVFAQLTPLHSQDKHTALYTYTHAVCHSGRQAHMQCRRSQMNTIQRDPMDT